MTKVIHSGKSLSLGIGRLMILLIAMILVLSIVACEDDAVKSKRLEFDYFAVDVPATWNGETRKGYDSYVGVIQTSDGQEITFDFGKYSNPLNVDADAYDIEYVVIDEKKAKVVRPAGSRKGITGVYFDSLEPNRIYKFTMDGTDLHPHNRAQFLNVMKSLKFIR